MSDGSTQDVFIHLGGQDDNLGDSVLRAAYFLAAQGPRRKFHVHFEGQTADYVSGLPLRSEHVLYDDRAKWVEASKRSFGSVLLFNAGEINPQRAYPPRHIASHMRQIIKQDGIVIIAGAGVKDPAAMDDVAIHPIFKQAALASWRDRPTRDAMGFGSVAPDWAFALGTETSSWAAPQDRPLIPVSLRFDRPLPDEKWFAAVKDLAARTNSRIVTLAQVARDAPRSVHLARRLDGEYLTPPSMSHADLDRFVREVYSQSLAVVSDRAHGLIIGASEGAYPLGTAANPQKIKRLLDAAGVGSLTGQYDEFATLGAQIPAKWPELAPAIDTARQELAALTKRINTAMDGIR